MMIIILFLLLPLASPAWATTYWAHPSGSDSATCTDIDGDDDPLTYGTIGRAAECATAAPWKIYLKAGTYTASTHRIDTQGRHVGEFVSGTAQTQNVIQTAPGETRATISTAGGWLNIGAGASNTTTESRNFITYREFKYSYPLSGFQQAIKPFGNHIIVEDCEMQGDPNNPLPSGGTGFTNGIFTRANAWVDDTLIVRRCIFHDFGSYAIYGMPKNSIFEHNEVYNVRQAALQLQYDHSNNVIRYNYIHNMLRASVASGACRALNVAGYTNPAGGGVAAGIKIHDNVFDLQCPAGTGGSAIEVYNTSGLIIANNIFTGTVGGSHILVGLFGSTSTGTLIHNNIFFGSSDNTIVRDAGSSATWTMTHNACRSADNCGTSSNGSGPTGKTTISALTDIITSSSDFTHKSGSAGINVGTSVSTRACNGTCDLGPYETWGFSSAIIDNDTANSTVFMDVTFGMNTNVPAQGSGTFTVGCTGSGCGTPVVGSNSLKTNTDSVYRLMITGVTGNACDAAQTWTVTGSGLRDSTNIGLTGVLNNQLITAFTAQGVTETCTGAGTTPPGTNLRIHYLFEEGTGTSAADEETTEGGDEPGTLTGSPTWTTGGVTFATAVEDYVAVPYGNTVNISSQSLTMCADIDPDETLTDGIFMGTAIGSSQRFYAGWWQGYWNIGIGTLSFSASTSTQFPLSAGRSLICIVGDATGDTATLWVNGVEGSGNNAKSSYTGFTLTGNIRVGGIDYSLYRPGATIYEWWLFTGAASDQDMADLYAAWSAPSPAPTGTFEQKTHKWQKLRKTGAGAAEDFTISGTTNGITMSVMVGGAINLVTQIDCTVANCDPSGFRLFYSKNSGTFTAVPSACGADGVCFYGTTDPDIVSGTVECCLTGALTENDGPTNTNAEAVPVIDLGVNGSFVRRSVLKFSTSVTAGDSFCFKEYHQTDLALNGGYTPTAGACVTIVGVAAGVGF